jgi:glycerol kinase
MASDSGRPPESLKVDDGATENDFLTQLQADVRARRPRRYTAAQGGFYV